VSGDILAHKVDDIIQKQTGLSGATFQQLYDHTGILLKIYATSLRTGELLEFSAMRTPNDQVCVASRCSMAVPFLFDAVVTKEGDRLVDGSVIDNCPVWCFDEELSSSAVSVAGVGTGAAGGAVGSGRLSVDSADFAGQRGGDPRRNSRLQPAAVRVQRALTSKNLKQIVADDTTGTLWIKNPRTLALWIQTGRDSQQAAPRSLQNFCVRVGDLVLHMLQQQQKETYLEDERVVWVQTPEIPISTFRLDHVLQAKLYAGVYVHTCIFTYVHAHIHTYTHTHTYKHAYKHTCRHICVCLNTYTCKYMCVYTYLYVYPVLYSLII